MPFRTTFDHSVRALSLPKAGPRIILIGGGKLAGLPPECRLRPLDAPARLTGLTADWIAQSGIGSVGFCLFSTDPDVWQIGAHLSRTGFSGRLFALSPALPNSAMVERELRAEFPALRLRVLPVLRVPN